ncbi:MAG: phosphoadenosine phosphosulfate reductase [Pseudorhodobacter sp.]|nr:phosphoadenosine phosphosulfate reductase [Pseudorhodobacter sp.]
MTTDTPRDADTLPDASDATDRDSWLARIDAIGEEAGYFQTIGQRHWAFFADESPTLLVSFETVDEIRATPTQLPKGQAIAAAKGWSHLCIIAEGETWYRDPAVYRYFDRLVDDAFFEDFDHVVFYGAGMGGYAACAYSVTAPGATVLAVQPRATLDPTIAVWDTRDLRHRRLNFTDRYGYAPDMIEGTGEVFVVFDHTQPSDAMHAALFTRPYVTMLRGPYLGKQVDAALQQMKVLPGLIEAACEGRLTPALYFTALRRRRSYGPYLKALMAHAEASGHRKRAAMICRNVVQRTNGRYFRKRLVDLAAELEPAHAE